MSGPTVGGGGGGDLFGNIFGGSQKQVYPPAPPGYKYVDLNIPQAPPGYTVARMSSIANNQSTAPATGTVLGGNAGLVGGRGAGGRSAIYGYTDPHSDAGIIARANQRAIDTMRRNELMGLVPSGSTDALRAGRPLPGGAVPSAPGVPNVPGAAAATPYTGVDYTKPPGATAATTPPGTPAVPPALIAAAAAGKRPKNPYTPGTPQWAEWDVSWKAIQAKLKSDAQQKLGINQGTGTVQDQIDAYMKTHGAGATPPAAPAPPAATAPPTPAPPAAVAPPPTPPNAPPAAPPPAAAAPKEPIPNLTGPSGAGAAPPVGTPDQPANVANTKSSWVPQVLQDIWSRMTAPPNPSFDPTTATINDQKYDPIPVPDEQQ